MFSQVTKTSAIQKHTIHLDTILVFGTLPRLKALEKEVDLHNWKLLWPFRGREQTIGPHSRLDEELGKCKISIAGS
jgi:hypothetical protein